MVEDAEGSIQVALQNYALSLCIDVSHAVYIHFQMAKLSIYVEERLHCREIKVSIEKKS